MKGLTQEHIDRIFDWAKENKDQLMIIGAVILFLIITIPLVINYKIKAKKELWEKFAIVQSLFYQGRFDDAVAQGDALINANPKSDQARLALFIKGNAFYYAGKYEDAVTAFQMFYTKYPSHYFTALAIYNLGYSYEMLGDYKNASDTFSIIINNYADSYLLASAYQNKARNLELMGDVSGALGLYNTIKTMFPNTIWATEADTKLNEMAMKQIHA